MTAFQVTVTMDVDTVISLQAQGSSLFVFKAVEGTDLSARPLIWSKVCDYSLSTFIRWEDSYCGYTSQNPICGGRQIRVGFSAPMETGQTMIVETAGIGTVDSRGLLDYISFKNNTNEQYTCGLSQAQGNEAPSPYCAFPLYGLNLVSIKPLNKVLLMFSTSPCAPGTVIDYSLNDPTGSSTRLKSTGSGVLIELADNLEREVNYDLNKGWMWDGGTWAQQISATANLVPLLIEA